MSNVQQIPGTLQVDNITVSNLTVTGTSTGTSTTPAAPYTVTGAPPANANNAALQVGGGSFAGGGAPAFSGSANGTGLGINVTGTADLINAQVSGVSKFKVDNTGAITMQGTTIYINNGVFFSGAGASLAYGRIIAPATSSGSTMAAGAAAGGAPPAPVVGPNSTGFGGTATFGTGTAPSAGAQVVVTFTQTYGNAPFVVVAPMNAATSALGLYVTSVTTNGFTVACANPPAAGQGNTVYAFSYLTLSSG